MEIQFYFCTRFNVQNEKVEIQSDVEFEKNIAPLQCNDVLQPKKSWNPIWGWIWKEYIMPLHCIGVLQPSSPHSSANSHKSKNCSHCDRFQHISLLCAFKWLPKLTMAICNWLQLCDFSPCGLHLTITLTPPLSPPYNRLIVNIL